MTVQITQCSLLRGGFIVCSHCQEGSLPERDDVLAQFVPLCLSIANSAGGSEQHDIECPWLMLFDIVITVLNSGGEASDLLSFVSRRRSHSDSKNHELITASSSTSLYSSPLLGV